MIYALFRVHTEFTVTVIYKLCSLETSLEAGECSFSLEDKVIVFNNIYSLCVPHRERYITCHAFYV